MRPEIGRFITVDPVGPVDPRTSKTNEKVLLNPQKLNRYSYSLNNPYKYIDPDGQFPQLLVPLIVYGIIQLGELMYPQTLESPHKDSFIDRYSTDLLLLPLGVESVCAKSISRQIAKRFATSAERLSILERIITSEGGIKTSRTVARHLANERSNIPTQSILDVIGSGTRIPDPKGVAGHFMYRAPATFNKTTGTLEVLVNEQEGVIEHVLFKRLPKQ